MIRLGYAGKNETLDSQTKTARLITIQEKGTDYALKLLTDNLMIVLDILQYNVKHHIYFYRVSSGIAPHLTNPALIKHDSDYRSLAYDIGVLRPLFKIVGDFAKANKIRLTFHPDPFVVLSTSNPRILTKTFRDLYMHYLFIKYMDITDSAIILHGGGIYGDKERSMQNWIHHFHQLPKYIQELIVLENDEVCYNVVDVLRISQATKVPIVFDIFHYYCYDLTITRKRMLGENLPDQPSIKEILPRVIATWPENRTVKMHISEQKPDSAMGSHSYYVKIIPDILLNFPSLYERNLDLMIEAKAKEKAVLRLYKKYPKILKNILLYYGKLHKK